MGGRKGGKEGGRDGPKGGDKDEDGSGKERPPKDGSGDGRPPKDGSGSGDGEVSKYCWVLKCVLLHLFKSSLFITI